MPPRMRRSPVHRRGSARRELVWATTDQTVNIPAGQISDLNLLAALSVAGSSLLGVTVIRTHVHIAIQTGLAAGVGWRFGLIIGRNTDVGVNVAGQQDPSNPELDWMYLDRVYGTFSGATADAQRLFEVDLRAKRRMQELNQAYLLCQTNTTAAAVNVAVWARTLLALP